MCVHSQSTQHISDILSYHAEDMNVKEMQPATYAYNKSTSICCMCVCVCVNMRHICSLEHTVPLYENKYNLISLDYKLNVMQFILTIFS